MSDRDHTRARATQCRDFLSGLCCGVLILVTPVAARGQEGTTQPAPAPAPEDSSARRLAATRITGNPPVIDGALDDPIWMTAEPAADFVQFEPDPGTPATERTEARILYDDETIYVGVRLLDSRPDSVTGHLFRRDEEAFSDWVRVALDTRRDRRTAFAFGVNPRGVRWDALLYDDTRTDLSWDAIWDAASRVDSLGWTAEFRIPLSQLRFNSVEDGGEQVWGLNIGRRIARRAEVSNWAHLAPESDRVVSSFGELVDLRGLEPPRRLEVQPHLLTRLVRAPGDPQDPFYSETELYGSLGLDAEYGLPADFTLVATLNPDFGQVEADPTVVNLTAYETFFPEKRSFFLEGADIFRYELGGTQLFYSRRIGREPQGDVDADYLDAPAATTILGAAKLSGKTRSGWSVGVLSALTAAEDARYVEDGVDRTTRVEPSTGYAVGRVVKQRPDGQGEVGGTVTATRRWLEPGDGLDFLASDAYAGGMDLRHRFRDGEYEVTAALLGSFVSGDADAITHLQRAPERYFQRPDAAHLELDSTRTSLAGLAAGLSLRKIGGSWIWAVGGHAFSPDFEVNGLGYQREADRISHYAYLGYARYQPGTVFQRWSVGLNQEADWNFGGERLATGLTAEFDFRLLNHWAGSFGVGRSLSALAADALRGGPALVAPGGFDAWFSLSSDDRSATGMTFYGNATGEDQSPGRFLGWGLSLRLRPSTRMEVSLGAYLSSEVNAWQYVALEESRDTDHFLFGRLDQRTVTMTSRLNYTFSPVMSLQLFAEPFIAAGDYSGFMEVRDPRARHFRSRFHAFRGEEIRYDDDEQIYHVDVDGDGAGDVPLADPSFSISALKATAVLQWEYRPGSTLYLVWRRERWGERPDGRLRLARGLSELFGFGGDALPATNLLLVKLNYWLGL